jgi:hypothetical protein
MPALELPRRRVALLHELGARLLDSRKPKTPSEPLARELLAGFQDICLRSGLDGVLEALGAGEDAALSDHPTHLPALASRIDSVDLDGGGPRNARPGHLTDAVVATLGLTVTDEPDRTISLPDTVRAEVIAAITAEVTPELTVPQIRESIVAHARARCEERHLAAFEKIVAQLDDRGLRMVKQPKVPLDASQPIQRLLSEARRTLLDRVGRAAIDRAQAIIARTSADAAARIDQPVTYKLTPRDVAILRAADARVPKQPAQIVESLVESLADLAAIAWSAPERIARPYSATQTFAVGELIAHPKFGNGTVKTVANQRIEVEFPDGPHTLVHVRPSK